MAKLDWRLLHERNLALMRERGLIGVDIARVKLKKLVQGPASMANLLTISWFWDEKFTWKHPKSIILLWHLYLPNTNTQLIPALKKI